MTQNGPKLDWVNLPQDVVAVSLWACLHDGELQMLRSDRVERTVTLEIDVAHVRRHHQLGEGVRFLICLQEV